MEERVHKYSTVVPASNAKSCIYLAYHNEQTHLLYYVMALGQAYRHKVNSSR